jgi:hypothetical protein
MNIINAFHPDFVKTHMPEFLTKIKADSEREATGSTSGTRSRAVRESVHGKNVDTINTFPKTRARKAALAPREFTTYSKAGTANTTKEKKK